MAPRCGANRCLVMHSGGNGHDQSTDLRQRTDAAIPNRWTGSPERPEVTSVEALQGVLNDLHVHQVELELQNEELRKAQRALEASRAKCFELYDLAPAGYCTVNEHGFIVQANLHMASLVGVARNALIKQRFSQYLSTDGADRFYLLKIQIAKTAEPQACELQMLKHDGTCFWAHLALDLGEGDGTQLQRIVLTDITLRKEEERLRRQSERYQRALLDNLPFIAWIKDKDGRILVANQQFADAAGHVSPASLQGKTDLEIWPEERARAYQSIDRFVMSSGKASIAEEIVEIRGKPVWFETSKFPVTYDIASIGTVGFSRDITDVIENRRIALQHRANEQRFNSFVSNATDVLFTLTPSGAFTYLSPQVKNVFGYEIGEILGQRFHDFIHPDDLPGCVSYLNSILDCDDKSGGVECRLKKKDGVYRWQQASASPVIDPGTDSMSIVGVSRDIQGTKMMQAALLTSEQHYRALFERSMAGIAETSPEKNWLRFNDRLCEIFGYSREELAGMTWAEMTHPDDLEADEKQFGKMLSAEIDDYSRGKRYIHRNGHLIHASIAVRAIRKTDSSIDFLITIVNDISKQRESEMRLLGMAASLEKKVSHRTKQLRTVSAQLTMAEERERRLLAIELHDNLSQTLALIKIKLCAGGPASLTPTSKELLELVSQADHTTRTITQQLSPPILRFGLLPALDWLTEEMERNYGISVAFRVEGEPTPLDDELQAILFRSAGELLINAAKHSGVSDASLVLQVTHHRLVLVVSDKGCGFDPAAVWGAKFEHYHFGLNSIHERIELIGGEMEMFSAPGKGCTVTLSVPYSLMEGG